MKRYIGTKVINATPMTRLAYNQFRGWALPANENGEDAGYLVEYTDGGSRNTETYAGYVSWSPKEQFEGAYREREAVEGLYPHQQRVVDEKADLDEKRLKLQDFLVMPMFKGLSEDEQMRLANQAAAMSLYSEILASRIAAF